MHRGGERRRGGCGRECRACCASGCGSGRHSGLRLAPGAGTRRNRDQETPHAWRHREAMRASGVSAAAQRLAAVGVKDKASASEVMLFASRCSGSPAPKSAGVPRAAHSIVTATGTVLRLQAADGMFTWRLARQNAAYSLDRGAKWRGQGTTGRRTRRRAYTRKQLAPTSTLTSCGHAAPLLRASAGASRARRGDDVHTCLRSVVTLARKVYSASLAAAEARSMPLVVDGGAGGARASRSRAAAAAASEGC